MRAKILIVAGLLALLAGAVYFFNQGSSDAVGVNEAARVDAKVSDKGVAQVTRDTPESAVPVKRGADVAIGDVFNTLKNGADAARTKAMLDALAMELRTLPMSDAARAVQDFLITKRDVETGAAFAIGAGGNLATAPTFRVWLLDQLGGLNPEAAADYARQILATPENADEWAVAMRNFARVRTAPADAAFLKTKARELLGEPRWQQEQGVGWLEAFDVVVHTRATELAPELSRLLVRTEDVARPVAHAAFLTLDRLVLAEPAAMLETLAASPELMKGREQTRANYFARADVRDARQRAVVERYLLDATRAPQELEKFAGLYPNANLMVSKNLLTPTVTFSRDELLSRDREALRVAEEWAKDPRFERIQPQVQKIRERLSVFVQQAER